VTGILMCALGSGAFIYGTIARNIINPEGSSP